MVPSASIGTAGRPRWSCGLNCRETAWFCDRCDVRKEYSGGFSLVGGKCKPGGIGTSWEKLFDVFRGVYFHWGWYFWLLLIIPWIGVCRALPLLALVLVALLRAFKTNKQTNLCVKQRRVGCSADLSTAWFAHLHGTPGWALCPRAPLRPLSSAAALSIYWYSWYSL